MGKRFGVKKVLPSVSPGKTWVGVFAELGVSVLIGLALWRLSLRRLDLFRMPVVPFTYV